MFSGVLDAPFTGKSRFGKFKQDEIENVFNNREEMNRLSKRLSAGCVDDRVLGLFELPLIWIHPNRSSIVTL